MLQLNASSNDLPGTYGLFGRAIEGAFNLGGIGIDASG
jgi:hypothetical protein